MAAGLSPRQRQALQELVADSTLTAAQADAVAVRLGPATDDDATAPRGWLAEAAGYLGGALTFAGAALLVGLSWDELSRTGQVAVLTAATLLLLAAGVAIGGGPRRLAAMTGGPAGVRRRVVSVLFAAAAGTGALAAGVAAGEYAGIVGGATGLALAALGYLVLPSLPVLLAAAALSVVTGTSVASEVSDTPVSVGLALVGVGVVWAALGLSRVLAHGTAATVLGAAIALSGAQLLLADPDAAPLAYLLTVVVAAGCLAAYAIDRSVLLLAAGVIGVTLAVSEAVADWTNGAAGGAAAVLTAGAVLLVGSGIALRLHRRRGRPGPDTSGHGPGPTAAAHAPNGPEPRVGPAL